MQPHAFYLLLLRKHARCFWRRPVSVVVLGPRILVLRIVPVFEVHFNHYCIHTSCAWAAKLLSDCNTTEVAPVQVLERGWCHNKPPSSSFEFANFLSVASSSELDRTVHDCACTTWVNIGGCTRRLGTDSSWNAVHHRCTRCPKTFPTLVKMPNYCTQSLANSTKQSGSVAVSVVVCQYVQFLFKSHVAYIH